MHGERGGCNAEPVEQGLAGGDVGGLVVVSATDEQQAWRRLKEADVRAYWWLSTGLSGIYGEDDLARERESAARQWLPGFPVVPEVFAPGELPVLVKYGAE